MLTQTAFFVFCRVEQCTDAILHLMLHMEDLPYVQFQVQKTNNNRVIVLRQYQSSMRILQTFQSGTDDENRRTRDVIAFLKIGRRLFPLQTAKIKSGC